MNDRSPGERLRQWVWEDFGLSLSSIDRIDFGADEAAELWRATDVAAARYAVKLSGGGTPAGLVVSAHLADHGVPGVPRPVPARTGRPWSDREERRLSVVSWVSDDRALTGGMSAEQWTFYGSLMARVHATVVTDALAVLLPHETYTHDRATTTMNSVDRGLRTLVAGPGAPADDLVGGLADEWHAVADCLWTLLESADGLGRQLRTERAQFVICHADPHLGNVLLDGGERIWLIDWDDSVLAPRECDLMFAIGGVFPPVSPQEQSWFFDGYGPVDADPRRLAYYRCTRALIDVADLAAQVLDVDGYTAADRADALSMVRGTLSPRGLVNLALSSLRDLRLISSDSPAHGSDTALRSP